MYSARQNSERGFTLLELLTALAIIAIIVAFAFSRFIGRDVAESLVQDAARRVRERRAAAMRLNPLDTSTVLENYKQPPLVIDFLDLSSTRPLVLDKTDSGAAPTLFQPPAAPGGEGEWIYSYRGLPIDAPAGWRVANRPAALREIPEIDRGEFATSVGFSAEGRPDPLPQPGGTSESPFWAIYFINEDASEARAIAIHATGLVEVWRYRATSPIWKGFQDRL